MNISALNEYLSGRYIADAMDESIAEDRSGKPRKQYPYTRRHADGSVCKASSPETCPFNKTAEKGERAITGREHARNRKIYAYLKKTQSGDGDSGRSYPGLDSCPDNVKGICRKAMDNMAEIHRKLFGKRGTPRIEYGRTTYGAPFFDIYTPVPKDFAESWDDNHDPFIDMDANCPKELRWGDSDILTEKNGDTFHIMNYYFRGSDGK